MKKILISVFSLLLSFGCGIYFSEFVLNEKLKEIQSVQKEIIDGAVSSSFTSAIRDLECKTDLLELLVELSESGESATSKISSAVKELEESKQWVSKLKSNGAAISSGAIMTIEKSDKLSEHASFYFSE